MRSNILSALFTLGSAHNLINLAARDDTCAVSATCADCTAASCGWCDGKAYDAAGLRSSCVPLGQTTSWTCDGTFKNTGQCECDGKNVPPELESVWRGFFIDGSEEGETTISLSNSASGTHGRIEMRTGSGVSKTGNATTFLGCPKNVLQAAFDDGSFMSCSYRLGWQDGGDAHALALGCNKNETTPDDFDTGMQTAQLFSCTDPVHCDFHLMSNYQMQLAASRRLASLAETHTADDVCESLDSCSACSAEPSCSWCMGHLSKDGAVLPGNSGCFSGASTSVYKCQGLTLTSSCTVHKCNWFEYFASEPPNCDALSASCAAPTTADDPDFHRNFPASPYLDEQACIQNCLDPTVGCDSGTCGRTNTCDPTSSCASCTTVKLATNFQGLMISNNYTSGLYTFNFTTTTDGFVYTALKVTAPDGTSVDYKVSSWTGKTGLLTSGSDVFGFLMDLSASSALGKNAYAVIGASSDIPSFGQAMYTPGASEYALLGCAFDYAGKPVSGQYKPLKCEVGHLHR